MKKIKSILTSVGIAMMTLPLAVNADGDIGQGTLNDVVNSSVGQQILNKLGPIFSAVINVAFAAIGISAAVKAVISFVKSKQTENSSEQKQLETTAKNCLFAVAGAAVGGLIVNLILSALGISFFSFNV